MHPKFASKGLNVLTLICYLPILLKVVLCDVKMPNYVL